MSDIFSSHFNLTWLNKLLSMPDQTISGTFSNTPYKAHLIIPHYKFRISEYYKDEIGGNLDQLCTRLNLPKVFKHFGVSIFFEKPLQLTGNNSFFEICFQVWMHQKCYIFFLLTIKKII